jgi:glycosyltransferase involved in cell wall biosynthesis
MQKIIYIVAPSGAAGGGMGRVKDYMLASGGDALGRTRFEALVTRDESGAAHSLLLLLKAILAIWGTRLTGRLALVHVHFGDKGSAARKGLVILAARAVGAPVILHLHAAELTQFYAGLNPLLQYLLRLPFRAASSVIVLGKLWRDWLVDDLGIEAKKIDILYNGVPVAVIPRDFAKAAPVPCRILFLGLLSERKGISDFLHGLAGIGPGAPAWEAVIAGNGDIPAYEAKARALGLEAHTRFIGWVDQQGVRRELARADMMVLPSYNEGLPLVILEALGSGTPVIATPIGAIPEVLEDGENVLFVTPGDRAGLAEAMTRLIADPALRQQLSTRGQARFSQQFTLEAFLASLFAIYAKRYALEIAPAAVVTEPQGAAA